MESYSAILEASIGYAGATAVAVIDEVAFVNERQEKCQGHSTLSSQCV